MLTSVMRMDINVYPNSYTSLKQLLPYMSVRLCSDLSRNVLVFCVKSTVCKTKLIGRLCIFYRISYRFVPLFEACAISLLSWQRVVIVFLSPQGEMLT
jgi:hypothetical protein